MGSFKSVQRWMRLKIALRTAPLLPFKTMLYPGQPQVRLGGPAIPLIPNTERFSTHPVSLK